MLVGKGCWARFGENEPKYHFWVVIADAGDEVLVVNLTAIRGNPDDDYACVFNAGEYPRVTKKSFIFYARATLVSTDTVLQRRLKQVDPKMFARIIAGAKKSDYFLFDDLL